MRLPLYAALACHRALKPGPTRGVVCCAEPSGYHVPVMLDEVLSWLVTDPAGTYADGTLGGGGHSAALLDVLAPSGGRLIALDRDPDALREAGARLQPFTQSGHAKLIHADFGSMPDALRGAGLKPAAGGGMLDGLLLDLGVSSHQLDERSRGFSFKADAPLGR